MKTNESIPQKRYTTSELYCLFLEHSQISTDSRKVTPQSLFFALKGPNFDGNDHATAALQNGASLVIVDNPLVIKNEQYILVDDVLKSLQLLANHHRKQMKTPIIAITGTNGKTTTKELLAAVLSTTYSILATEGNLNNHIGVPLTLLKLKSTHQYAIIEMGANKLTDIAELTAIAEPDYGIITNVGEAHLEGFGSIEGVIAAKSELYHYLQKNKKTIFIHADDTQLLEAAADSENVISYGQNKHCFISGSVTGCSPFVELEWKNLFESTTHQLKTHLIGSYNGANILVAITIGSYFDVSYLNINNGISNYMPTNNRSQLMQTSKNRLIIDAYNANPTSMMAALTNFVALKTDLTKTIILGDMLELGESSQIAHQQVIDYLLTTNLQTIFLVGTHFKTVTHPYQSFGDVNQLIDYFKNQPIANQYVLIKGSRGIKLESVIEWI